MSARCEMVVDGGVDQKKAPGGGGQLSDCARSIPYSPSVAWDDVAFSSEKWIGTLEMPVSQLNTQLNTQLMVSPVNASRRL